MKSFKLSESDRMYKILKSIDVLHAEENTFCDITGRIISKISAFLFSIFVIAAIAFPFIDLSVWFIVCAINHIWFFPRPLSVVFVGLYASITLMFLAYGFYDKLKYNRIIKRRALELEFSESVRLGVHAEPSVMRAKFCRDMHLNEDSELVKFLCAMHSYRFGEPNNICSIIRKLIGSSLLILLMLSVLGVSLYPLILLAAWIVAWIVVGQAAPVQPWIFLTWIIEILFIALHVALFCYSKAKNAAQQNEFIVTAWNNFKDKTCVKINIVK